MIVNHLVEDRHVVAGLKQLHVVVVGARQHGRSPGRPRETPFLKRPLRRRIVAAASGAAALFVTCPQSASVLSPLPSLRRQGWDPPIRRIHDERGSLRSHDVRSEVPPEFVVRTVEVGASIRSLPALACVPTIAILSLGRLFFECGRFLLGEKFLPSKLARSFQRSNGRVSPESAQIRLAVGGTRRSTLFGRRLRARRWTRLAARERGGRQQRACDRADEPCVHHFDPFCAPFSAALVLRASSRQDVREGIIPLVTGVLVQLPHRHAA